MLPIGRGEVAALDLLPTIPISDQTYSTASSKAYHQTPASLFDNNHFALLISLPMRAEVSFKRTTAHPPYPGTS